MGNVLFCPRLHQAGIDCVSGAGFVVMRHPPLLETFHLGKSEMNEAHATKPQVNVDLPPSDTTKDLACYGFGFRFTEPVSEQETKASTGKTSSDVQTSPNEFNFATRLYHTESDTMITPDNFRKFGLHGKVFDDVSSCC